jgi:AcrR family transcriptional regulator
MARTARTGATLRDDIFAIKRERILKEAVALFHENGYLPTNVEAIAQRLEATKPFVYYHFKSKIDLLSEICERVMREALEVTEAAAEADVPPLDKLVEFVRNFTDVVLNRHEYVAIYFREHLNLPPDVDASVTAMRKKIDYRLRDILREGKQSGVFHFANLAVASQIVAGMISYTFAWYDESIQLSKSSIRQQMTEHVLQSVGVDRSLVSAIVGSDSV